MHPCLRLIVNTQQEIPSNYSFCYTQAAEQAPDMHMIRLQTLPNTSTFPAVDIFPHT